MKTTYETSTKARCMTGWHKHLRREGKQMANRATRRIAKAAIGKAT